MVISSQMSAWPGNVDPFKDPEHNWMPEVPQKQDSVKHVDQLTFASSVRTSELLYYEGTIN